MAEEKMMRLSQVARKLNVGSATIVEYLFKKGFKVENNPNSKITMEQVELLQKEFESSVLEKKEANEIEITTKIGHEDEISNDNKKDETITSKSKVKLAGVKLVGKIELPGNKKKKTTTVIDEESLKEKKTVEEESVEEKKEEPKNIELIEGKADTLKGLTVIGKIELPAETVKKEKNTDFFDKKKKRKRIIKVEEGKPQDTTQKKAFIGKPKEKETNKEKEEISDKEIQEKIKNTLAKLSGKNTLVGKSAKYRKDKRNAFAEAKEEESLKEKEQSKILKVAEFVSANDLALLIGVSVNEIISTCLSLGMFVSINQRLDAELITVIADEFGYKVDFTTIEEESKNDIAEEKDDPSQLVERAPIVTIMGHVDHGKTTLLDYIRSSKVTTQEAGGITQHIGAYDVVTDNGKRIVFLDTPGHEAFTAMRARGAKITDIVVIVVAADDNVMPQTKEAINHAQVAGVPIIIAINKIDKPDANPNKIKEELAQLNILVEDWGGKYQSQELSAKKGIGVPELLNKILLEAELLELKANPNKKAIGTVIEASLDKGRGYVTTLLVQSGTLHIGDIILAGAHYGRVKAMMDHRGTRLKTAIPSTPIQILGFDGAPQAGDKFSVMDSDREAREIATKREQILREQSIRTKKHITLDEIGRRLAIGNFKQLNIIIKGDVDGSVEALSDSLLKLSTKEIQVVIIHKAVGPISESDVLLASASDAVIIGFQVRPTANARKLNEHEQIEIRLYSIIYNAIEELKHAMEGMLEPKLEEVIVGNAEVREVFKISKMGTVAGCYLVEGYIKRANRVRLIRDGIVVFSGDIDQLKRFKEDVSEVRMGFECGISIKNFNDIKTGDIIESYENREVKRKL